MVVRPRPTSRVAAVVAWCACRGVAVVPQGGNTGLVGGSVPLAGEVVLSPRGLDGDRRRRRRRRPGDGRRRRHPRAVQAPRRAAGWAYGVDLGARDSRHDRRHGRDQRRRAPRAALRRHAGPGRSASRPCSATVGGRAPRRPAEGQHRLRPAGAAVRQRGHARRRHRGPAAAGAPLRQRVVALARPSPIDGRARWPLAARLRRSGAPTSTPSSSSPRRPRARVPALRRRAVRRASTPSACWSSAPAPTTRPTRSPPSSATCRRGRRGRGRRRPAAAPSCGATGRRITEAINPLGPPHKLDVTLPAAGAGGVRRRRCRRGRRRRRRARPGCSATSPTATSTSTSPASTPTTSRSTRPCSRLVAERGGSISAEHGIGTAKRPWLHLIRSPAELAAMRAIKAALDPDGILNPTCSCRGERRSRGAAAGPASRPSRCRPGASRRARSPAWGP